MKLIKVGAASLNQIPLDWDHNTKNIIDVIERAKAENISILCLPEMCISGYGCEDAFLSLNTINKSREMAEIIAEHTDKKIVVSLGLPFYHEGAIYNAVCLIANRKILGYVFKQNLAGDGIHYEPRWFKEWPKGKWSFDNDESYGDLIFNVGDVRIGFEICEDAWTADRPGSRLAAMAVDVILNPSASHFAFGKHEIRKRLVAEGSRAFGCAYIYSNLLGNESGRVIYDGDCMIASEGKILTYGKRLSFQDNTLTSAVIDIDQNRINRARTVSYRPNHDSEDMPWESPKMRFNFPEITETAKCDSELPWELNDPELKMEEFTRAEGLGLWDYMRKSKSTGFVVSLSGGCDSAVVACLVRKMIHEALMELRGPQFLKKIEYSGIKKFPVFDKLLTCVYQESSNSSQTTSHAAEIVATNLKARFIRFNITPIIISYETMISEALQMHLTWENNDIALQNIQARVRAPGVWMIANIKNALLLATSNRSEAAVGYATMDGDTCGGLSPIAGIDKAFLINWLHWMQGKEMDFLSCVINQKPTAELRPAEQEQTDEKDLMPYPILDAIEKAMIRDKKSPVETFLSIKMSTNIDNDILRDYVIKFVRLWSRNQWKRERYAPSFHLDDENLDPKTWCRYPILSSGCEVEIRELIEYVKTLSDISQSS